jgi:hypothetical protein
MLVAEQHVLRLGPRLEQPSEPVGVLAALDDLVSSRQLHVRLRVMVHPPYRVDEDRLLVELESSKVVAE